MKSIVGGNGLLLRSLSLKEEIIERALEKKEKKKERWIISLYSSEQSNVKISVFIRKAIVLQTNSPFYLPLREQSFGSLTLQSCSMSLRRPSH